MTRCVDIRIHLFAALIWAVAVLMATSAGSAFAAAPAPVLDKLPPATHAGTPAVGASGTVWFDLFYGSAFQGDQGSSIGRLTRDGTFSDFSLPEGRVAGVPVATRDGGIWFPERYAEEQGFGVARVTASGQLQEYTVGGGEGSIGSVAPLEGDLWFVATRPDGPEGRTRTVIDRLDAATDGSVEQELLLGSQCYSRAIAAGAGAIWFTESCRGKFYADIVRIDAEGDVARYPLAEGAHPISIAVGSGETVWFGATRNESPGPSIGRITPRGEVVEYPVPDGRPETIAVGPGGRVWFSSTFGGGVPRALDSIGGRGQLSKPICVDPKCRLGATGLATGPDGSLWFSAEGLHTIGGGGFTQIIEGEDIANEAGFVGRLAP